jgi:carbamoyl-phosphate synthase large subunit
MKQVHLLFTSAGRRVELLRAFRKAFGALGVKGRIVALDRDPLAPTLQVADVARVVPGLHDPDYLSTLLRLCEEEAIDAVFPLIDPDIAVLARHAAAIRATGARPIVVSEAAARLCNDKWLQAAFFQSLGLATPQTWLPGDCDPRRVRYPVVVKPRDGSGGANVFKINNPQELEWFSCYVPHALVQEYLPGAEITTDVICDLDGALMATVSRRRLEVRSGEVSKGVTVYDPVIARGCAAVARALPAVGPVTVQCMMRDGVPHFTEINARFGGGVTLGIAAGVDTPQLMVARQAGLTVPVPPLGRYRIGCTMSRFDDAFFSGGEEDDEAVARGDF